jgi:hypothetical protein
MPYGKCILLEEKTRELGTDILNLTKGSRQKIAIKCEDCLVEIIREYKGYHGLHKCKTIINGLKKCFKCKTKKEVSEFAKNRASHDGYSKLCKECYSSYGSVKRIYREKSQKFKQDIETYFKYKTSSIKTNSRKLELAFDLDPSGIEMVHNQNSVFYNSISVDKKDPKKGYTKNNVVLCAFCINSFKGEKNEEEFKQMLKDILIRLQEFAGSK